jgi:7-carboxy-7-deazaguanine synthase (Cx14CxxC type)
VSGRPVTPYSIQGEGANVGRPAVFVRFSGCNLWSGRESDRAKAICQFCDTDFRGTDGTHGGKYATATDLAKVVAQLLPFRPLTSLHPLLVCTGGEPLLQLDEPLLDAFHTLGFEVAVETNGTLPLPDGLDWVCVSPKARTKLAVTAGNELKLVYPQDGLTPEQFEDMTFDHFFLQPMDGPNRKEHTALVIDYCLQNPQWRLSVQLHKFLGLA